MIPRLGFGKSERAVRDARKVHRKTDCFVRVGESKNDGGHESNPSCQVIAKVPSICRIKAVFMMGIDKRVKETQNHNTILKAPQNTWEMKSCNRQFLGGKIVAFLQKERKMLKSLGHSL